MYQIEYCNVYLCMENFMPGYPDIEVADLMGNITLNISHRRKAARFGSIDILPLIKALSAANHTQSYLHIQFIDGYEQHGPGTSSDLKKLFASYIAHSRSAQLLR